METRSLRDIEDSGVIEVLLDAGTNTSSPIVRLSSSVFPLISTDSDKSEVIITSWDMVRQQIGDVLQSLLTSPCLRNTIRTKAPAFVHQAWLIIAHLEKAGDETRCLQYGVHILCFLGTIYEDDADSTSQASDL